MKRFVCALLALAAGMAGTGCAVTRSTLQTEDGATMKSWAVATTGSKLTGRDLQQAYRGAAADGSEWEATTGDRADELSSESVLAELIAEVLLRAIEAP